jgi:ADP-heptose:LPS heptosyltransferase
VNGNAIVAPPISIRQLTALTQRAVLFVAGDTGPMHIAAALGVPTVAVLGPTKGERNGPLGGHTRWIDAGLGCIGCRRRKCPDGTDACMRGVQPDDVFDLVKDVLGIVDADANADADAEAEADAEVAERE